MKTKIIMPQLGESVVDGTVGEWLKQIGDSIDEFEPIVRVITDKVDTEIPSPAGGTLLAIYVDEGETVDSGVVLGVIGDANDMVDGDDTPQAVATMNGNHEKTSTTPATKSTVSQQGPNITPVVARMAQEHRLDLSQIDGSGRNGRITKKDVVAFLEKQETTDTTAIPAYDQPVDGDLFKPTVEYGVDAPSETKAEPESKPKPITQLAPVPQDVAGELVDISPIRRSIADHMVRSKLQISPHVTTVFEVDMSAVLKHRKQTKEQLAKQGVKLTLTPYFVQASAIALQQYPYVNSQWTDDGIYLHHSANVGVAVAIDDGLIVPVIRNAQDFNLTGLARQVNDLADRARNRQLNPDEVQGGTFTITNHGVSGSLVATPIINQPQVAILGVGIIEKRVKVINDAIAIRPCCYLSLTFDHRVIDGATGDNFLMSMKNTLENWS